MKETQGMRINREAMEKRERQLQHERELNGPDTRRYCGFQSAAKDFVFVSSILRTKQDIDWQVSRLTAMRALLPDEAGA